MPPPAQRAIYIAHRMPGRLRMTLPWLRADRIEAKNLADHLASLGGMLHAEVRMRTVSVVCKYDEVILNERPILSIVRRHTRVMRVVLPGDAPRKNGGEHITEGRGQVGCAIEEAFRSANSEMLHATDGRMDVGVAGAFAFLLAGAAEIVTTGKIPAPPWFNLAWWAFRTFTLFPHGNGTPVSSPQRRVAQRARRAEAGKATTIKGAGHAK